MKIGLLLTVAMFSFLILGSVGFADELNYYVARPLNATGYAQPNTLFSYELNYTSDSGCASVLYSETVTTTTDRYGNANLTVNTTDLTTPPEYLCIYRNTSLEDVVDLSTKGLFETIYTTVLDIFGDLSLQSGNRLYFDSGANRSFLYNSSLGVAYMRDPTTVGFLISEPGTALASLHPRSFMIGGNQTPAGILTDNMNNCTMQGYEHIDCATGTTGADLGVWNELEVKDNVYIGNGANYTQISATGEITLYGTARVRRKVQMRSASVSGGGATPPDELIINGVATIQGFDRNTEEETFGVVVLPDDYVDGSDIYVYTTWSPADATAGNVVWGIEYNYATPESGDTLNAATTIMKVTDVAPGTADEVITASVLTVNGTGIVEGDLVNIRFFRDATNTTDTYNADAQVSFVDVTYLSDAMGS